MTAGTKAILLLSVVGLIVLVAWYGDGPTQGFSEETRSLGSMHATDPLLAAASERRDTRRSVRSNSPPTPAREIPSPPQRRDRVDAAGDRLGGERAPATSAGNESRAPSSPPTLEMGQAIDASVEQRWQQSKWNDLAAQIRAGAKTPSRPVDSSPTTTREQLPPAPPAQSRAPAAQPTAQGTHMVKVGDTLGHIAQQHYGAASRWHLIADANPGVDPSSLRVGQELVIPKGSRVSRPASTTNGAGLPAPDGRTHTIGEGETLSSIAEDHLGHEKHWYRIYELNEKRIGNNPDRLVLGMVIALPG